MSSGIREWIWSNLSWVLGMLMTLAGLSVLLNDLSQFLGGVIWILTGILVLPPVRVRVLERVTSVDGGASATPSKTFAAIVFIAGVTVGGAFIPTTDGAPDGETQSTVPETTATAGTPTVTAREVRIESTQSPVATTPTQSETPTEPRTAWTVDVVDVVDGDTVDVRMPDGTVERVRLLGVDTPETTAGDTNPSEWENIPLTESGRTHLADWGQRATGFAEQRLAGQTVYIEVDESADRRGSFGRLLAYVYQSEGASKSLNERLLENGYARLFETGFTQRATFEAAEASAQSGNVGVWDYAVTTPSRTPSSTSTPSSGPQSIEIADINADAAGNEYDNLNGEYTVLENAGGESVDLGEWTLSDDDGHTYTFPSGYELDPGATVTVRTGQGEDTASDLYWGRDAPVWNNGGDVVTVATDSGEVITERTYE